MPRVEILQLLVCPETHQKLTLAAADQVKRWNQKIAAGQLVCRSGKVITQSLESALVREDHLFAYPIRNDLPIMLIDESFSVA